MIFSDAIGESRLGSRVLTRDPTDANAVVSGGCCWHGQSARTPGKGHPIFGTGDMEAVMKFLFDDESFSFETLRASPGPQPSITVSPA